MHPHVVANCELVLIAGGCPSFASPQAMNVSAHVERRAAGDERIHDNVGGSVPGEPVLGSIRMPHVHDFAEREVPQVAGVAVRGVGRGVRCRRGKVVVRIGRVPHGPATAIGGHVAVCVGVDAIDAHAVDTTGSASNAANAYNPVSLKDVNIPAAKLNRTYSPYDLKQLLEVSNETTPDKNAATWSMAGTLPAGLSFNAATATLSGTPTALTAGSGNPVTVTATYKSNQGQRVYSILVGEAVLDAVSFSSNANLNCAVTVEGAAKCWGYSGSRALGTGTTTSFAASPVQVVGLTSTVSKIAAGSNHACAVLTDGSVKCWGGNGWAERGIGPASATLYSSPQPVPGLTGVVDISAGDNHTCVIMNIGTMKCWGANQYGQLGIGTLDTWRGAPVDVANVSGVTKISAGEFKTCALTTGGALKCWGYNQYGALGNGSTTNTGSPATPVGFDAGVTDVAIGYYNVCSIKGGQVYCAGRNNGKVIDLTATASYATPQAVSGVGTAIRIAVGGQHACAIRSNNSVTCWGNNAYAQAGVGSKVTPVSPGTEVLNTTEGVTDVQTKGWSFHTCAKTTAGKIKCWGQGGNYALGNGGTTDQTSAVQVLD